MTLNGGKTIVSLPYSYDINDKQAFVSMNTRAVRSIKGLFCSLIVEF